MYALNAKMHVYSKDDVDPDIEFPAAIDGESNEVRQKHKAARLSAKRRLKPPQ